MEEGDDVRYWKPAVHGEVTPKLAYIHRCPRANVVPWGQWIWAQHIPVRRSILIWRLILKRLPTWDYWRKHDFEGPSRCVICKDEEESLDHIFWNCRVVRVVWYVIFTWFDLDPGITNDFRSFMEWALKVNFGSQLLGLWKAAVISCVGAIWMGRNNAMFEAKEITTYGILAQVLTAIREANNFSLGSMKNNVKELFVLRNLGVTGRTSAPREPIAVSWWPPRVGWVKANTDGAATGAPGQIHAGGIFRDAGNAVLGCFHVSGGSGYAFEAELLGVIAAIAMAEARGWKKLWIEADSTYVIDLLRSRSQRVPWRFASAWRRTLHTLNTFELNVSHIYREGNVVADIMARSSTPSGFWPQAIPIISAAVERDFSVPRFYRWK